MASTIAAVTTSGGGVVTTADASGNLNLLAGTTTVVAITTAGAAVTGTLTSTVAAAGAFTTLSASGATTLSSTLAVTGVTTIAAGTIPLPALTTVGDTDTGISFPAANKIAFSTGGSEAFRTENNDFYIGTNTPFNSGKLCLAFDGGSRLGQTITDVVSASGQIQISFYVGAIGSTTNIGSISRVASTSAVAYNTTSDERLKEKIEDALPAGAIIDSIRIRQYDWKNSGGYHQDYGVIAQEVVLAVPQAVTQGKTDADTWSVAYDAFVPLLIKEIQSLRERVAKLEAKA